MLGTTRTLMLVLQHEPGTTVWIDEASALNTPPSNRGSEIPQDRLGEPKGQETLPKLSSATRLGVVAGLGRPLALVVTL